VIAILHTDFQAHEEILHFMRKMFVFEDEQEEEEGMNTFGAVSSMAMDAYLEARLSGKPQSLSGAERMVKLVKSRIDDVYETLLFVFNTLPRVHLLESLQPRYDFDKALYACSRPRGLHDETVFGIR